ncbi:MAG: methyl-accepting chemotaxis protein [Labrys sp. (in: a-proteobacteria)]|jgi:methyl-accepting chemotaxis protein
MYRRLSLSLTTRITGLAVALMIVTGLCVAGVAIWRAQVAFEQLFETSQLASNRAGLEMLRQAGNGTIVADGPRVQRVEMESLPKVDDHVLVDRIVWMNGGVSTILEYRPATRDFMRVSTTARKPDGSRGVGIALDATSAVHAALSEKRAFYGPSVVAGVRFMSWFTPIMNGKGDLIGAIAVGNSVATIDGLINEMLWQLGLASLLVVLGGAAVIIFALRFTVRPIQHLSMAASTLARDEETTIPYLQRRDEIGSMAAALDVLARASVERRRLAAETADVQAARARRQAAVEEAISVFGRSTREVMDSISTATMQLRDAALSMRGVADETNRQSAAVTMAATEASGNVQAVAASSEELAASIAEISRQVDQASDMSRQAALDADDSADKVARLATAAQKIGGIVGMITDIAGQTNLLALNATIEAARAGEAGKGFAVVASEVKSLAEQTARATQEIARHIADIQTATQESASSITNITARVQEINQIASAVASAVKDQGAATHEIAQNVQEAAQGTNKVSTNITGVTRAAQDTSATSQQVDAAANALSSQSEELQRRIEAFLQTVRAA